MADRVGPTTLRGRQGGFEPATDALAHHLWQRRPSRRTGLVPWQRRSAFAKARESASGDEGAPGRLAADYGLWVGSFIRGDLPSMQAHAAAFLSDLEATPGYAGRPASPAA